MGDCARLRLGSPQSPTPPARPQLQTGYRPQSACSPPGSPSPTNSPPGVCFTAQPVRGGLTRTISHPQQLRTGFAGLIITWSCPIGLGQAA